jgi:undecaprenyl-diphosphatase
VEGCGGRYGFASSHASNAFGLTTFLFLLLRKTHNQVWILFIWAGLSAYSRIYLGVHYPGDILVGAFIGVTAAFLIYYLLKYFRTSTFKENSAIP